MRWPNNHHRTLEVAQWRQARLWQTISTPPCYLVEVPKTLQTQKRKEAISNPLRDVLLKAAYASYKMPATCMGGRLFYHTWFSSLMTWGAVVSSFMPCPRHWLCAPALLSRSFWSISCAIWSMKQLLIHTATRSLVGVNHMCLYTGSCCLCWRGKRNSDHVSIPAVYPELWIRWWWFAASPEL